MLNAVECCQSFGIGADELMSAWCQAVDQKRRIVVRDHMECCLVDLERNKSPVYCINGFYLNMRDSFLSPHGPAHYFLLEFDQVSISWSEFSEEIIGSPNPSAAAKYSIRGQLLRHRDHLGIKDINPSIVYNFFDVSLSSLQCCAAKVNWLNRSILQDPLGKHLLVNGFSEEVLTYLISNPVVSGATIFSHIEELEFSECVQILQVLAKKVQLS